jgi:hypothetical protein
MTVLLYALLPLICLGGMGACVWLMMRVGRKGASGADQGHQARTVRSGVDERRDSAGTGVGAAGLPAATDSDR